VLKTAEIGNHVDTAQYDAQLPQLRTDLLNAQFDLRSADFPVIILVSGDARLGARQLAHLLNEWLDARFVETHLFPPPTEEELERPSFWRYWRRLPPRGQTAIFVGGTTQYAIDDAARGRIDDAEFDRRAARMLHWERSLVDDGALLLKFWLHLPKKEHRRRLAEAKKRPDVYWRVDERDWRIYEQYDAAVPYVERWLRRTSSHRAPWRVVEATDPRYRNLVVGRALASAISSRLAAAATRRPLGDGDGAFVPPPRELTGSRSAPVPAAISNAKPSTSMAGGRSGEACRDHPSLRRVRTRRGSGRPSRIVSRRMARAGRPRNTGEPPHTSAERRSRPSARSAASVGRPPASLTAP